MSAIKSSYKHGGKGYKKCIAALTSVVVSMQLLPCYVWILVAQQGTDMEEFLVSDDEDGDGEGSGGGDESEEELEQARKLMKAKEDEVSL